MLAASQRDQELKFEVLVPIAGDEPTAVASFNYHQDHFAETYGITLARRRRAAHTACLGFGAGADRRSRCCETHGLDPRVAWPARRAPAQRAGGR